MGKAATWRQAYDFACPSEEHIRANDSVTSLLSARLQYSGSQMYAIAVYGV